MLGVIRTYFASVCAVVVQLFSFQLLVEGLDSDGAGPVAAREEAKRGTDRLEWGADGDAASSPGEGLDAVGRLSGSPVPVLIEIPGIDQQVLAFRCFGEALPSGESPEDPSGERGFEVSAEGLVVWSTLELVPARRTASDGEPVADANLVFTAEPGFANGLFPRAFGFWLTGNVSAIPNGERRLG